MTTTTTFVDPTLAAIYDIAAPTGTGFARVNLNPTGQRAGLRTCGFPSESCASNIHLRHTTGEGSTQHPPMPGNTDPARRGRHIDTRAIGHSADHARPCRRASTRPVMYRVSLLTDPIGLALEKFDSIGRFRETDNGYEIDASGDLDTVEFDNARGLGRRLQPTRLYQMYGAHNDAICLGSVGIGREAESHIDTLEARFEQSGYRLSARPRNCAESNVSSGRRIRTMIITRRSMLRGCLQEVPSPSDSRHWRCSST